MYILNYGAKMSIAILKYYSMSIQTFNVHILITVCKYTKRIFTLVILSSAFVIYFFSLHYSLLYIFHICRLQMYLSFSFDCTFRSVLISVHYAFVFVNVFCNRWLCIPIPTVQQTKVSLVTVSHINSNNGGMAAVSLACYSTDREVGQ